MNRLMTRFARLAMVTTGALVWGAGGASAAGQASLADERLQAALTRETVDGRCAEAIPLYEQVIATTGATRATMASALLHWGGCLEQLRRPVEARPIYERILSQHADSGPILATARERLSGLARGCQWRQSCRG